ncbi:tetratricopeptide repeat protein [Candidatus Woesearchaeota archaeon]|nr:tetratricopeptide repeat protein [Candidatus Woesearchaeota archaeon]
MRVENFKYSLAVFLVACIAFLGLTRGWCQKELTFKEVKKIAEIDWDKRYKETKQKFGYHFKRGIAFAEVNDYKNAVDEFKDMLQMNPDDPTLYLLLGSCYSFFGEYNKAIKTCKKAIKLNADLADAHFMGGKNYAALGRYKEARVWLKKAKARKSVSSTPYLNLNSLKGLDEVLDIVNRIIFWKESIGIWPWSASDVKKHHQLGLAYLRLAKSGIFTKDEHIKEQYAEAVKEFKREVKINYKSPRAYYRIGEYYFELKQYKKAIKWLRKAAQYTLDDSEIVLTLGIVYSILSEKLKMAEIYKDNPAERFNLEGMSFERQYYIGRGHYSAARWLEMGYYWNLDDLDSVDWRLHYQKAEDAYRKSLKIKPDFAMGHYALGVCLIMRNDRTKDEEAVLEFEKALELNPGGSYVAVSHFYIGETWYRLAFGKYIFSDKFKKEKAPVIISHLKKAMLKKDVEKRHDDVHFYLGRTYLYLGRYKDAFREYKVLREINREKAKELFKMAGGAFKK